MGRYLQFPRRCRAQKGLRLRLGTGREIAFKKLGPSLPRLFVVLNAMTKMVSLVKSAILPPAASIKALCFWKMILVCSYSSAPSMVTPSAIYAMPSRTIQWLPIQRWLFFRCLWSEMTNNLSDFVRRLERSNWLLTLPTKRMRCGWLIGRYWYPSWCSC